MKYLYLIPIYFILITESYAQDWKPSFGPQETTVYSISTIRSQLYLSTAFGNYRSYDSGENWEELLLNQEHISGFVECDNKLFAAAKDGIFISDDDGITWNKNENFPAVRALKISAREPEVFILFEKYGLYYSTDCGNTWETITTIFSTPEGQVDIDNFSINDLSILVSDLTGKIFISNDKGKNWDNIKWPSKEHKPLVTCIAGWNDSFLVGTEKDGIYRINEKGRQVSKFSRGIYRGLRIHHIEVGSNGNLMASAGFSGYTYNSALGEWKILPLKTNSQVINCMLDFEDEIFVAINENGLFKNKSETKEWNRIFQGIRPGSQVTKIVPDDDIIWAGTRFFGNGVFKSADYGKTWEWAGIRDNISALFANTSYVIAGSESGKIYFSKNDGINWAVSELPNKNKSESMTTILSLAYSDEVMYAGNWNGFFRSIDGGFTWSQQKINGAQAGRTTSILASGNFLLVATSRGVFRSFDAGVSWNYLNEGLPSDIYVISISQSGRKFILATENSIYISQNYGQSWEKFSEEGLPENHQISSVTVLGENLIASVYAHGDRGVVIPKGVYFFNGEEWKSLNYGLEEKDIYCIASDAERIYAGVEWEGIFVMDRMDMMILAKETEQQ
jgi:photosystem II stability/assembly factor-like uncharacterized protein